MSKIECPDGTSVRHKVKMGAAQSKMNEVKHMSFEKFVEIMESQDQTWKDLVEMLYHRMPIDDLNELEAEYDEDEDEDEEEYEYDEKEEECSSCDRRCEVSDMCVSNTGMGGDEYYCKDCFNLPEDE